MQTFVERVKAFLLKEKGITDITALSQREMPVEREKYDLRLVRGNVNLAQGRFITKAEADAIVEKFIQMEIPYKQQGMK